MDVDEFINEQIAWTKKRKSESAARAATYRKKPKVRRPERGTKNFSDSALERMDLRRHNAAIAREGTFTKRQAEVFQHVANGIPLRLIALKLHIAYGTLLQHVYRGRQRLEGKNNVNTVAIALRKGLIQ